MTAGRVFLGLSFWMVFLLQLASKSIDNSSSALVTVRGTKHCPWTASSCSDLLQFSTNSVSQSWSASTNHDVLEISIQDGLFPKDVLGKQQHRALIAMQQRTYIGLNHSAKFSHLIKTNKEMVQGSHCVLSKLSSNVQLQCFDDLFKWRCSSFARTV